MVAPRPLENQRRKHQKTDRLDARALLDNLESYLRGKRDAMSIVAVPSPLQEQQRSVVRYREQLVRNRRRSEARGRALALTQGILAPEGWWRPAAWKQFKTPALRILSPARRAAFGQAAAEVIYLFTFVLL